MSARVGSFTRLCRPTPPETLRLPGLMEKVPASIACDFDYVGFWDLRISVAEKYQVGRVFIAGDAAHSSALRRLRPQQWPRRRGKSRLEDRRKAQRLGQRRSAADLHRRTAPDLQGNGGRLHRGRHPAGQGFLARYSPSANAPNSSAPGRSTPTPQRPVLNYEPNYEAPRSPSVRPAASAAPTAHTPSKHAPATICHRSFLFPAATSSRNWARDFTLLAFDAEDQTVLTFAEAAKTRGVPLKIVRDSYRDGRTAYEARSLILVRGDRYIAWFAFGAPVDTRRQFSAKPSHALRPRQRHQKFHRRLSHWRYSIT